MLGPRLLALHNVSFLVNLMRRAREALHDASFTFWSQAWLDRYRAGAQSTS